MKQLDLDPVLDVIVAGHGYRVDQVEYPADYLAGVVHTTTHIASCMIFDQLGINMSDADTLADFLKIDTDEMATRCQLKKRLVKYINSEDFAELVESFR